jgi:hypothetical protein
MDFAEQERRPEQIVGSEVQTVPLGGSDETSMPPVHVGDYYKLPKALQRSHFFEDQPTPSQEKTQGKSNAVVPEQAQRSELKQTVAPTYQSFAPRGSDESLMPPVHAGDYNSLPKALQRSHFFDDPPAPIQQKVQGPSKGASAPMRVAQADMGMNDDFWWKALAGAGLAILQGGEYIITGSAKAVDALYRNIMKARQNSGKGKEEQSSDAQPLPRDKNGVPIPDSEYPHTQLGNKKGSKGTYRQTREWGSNGQLNKDTDWTDHGRPGNHSNPHDHDWIPNPTGGSLQRGPAKPVPRN